jgi:hypothetical protein
MTDWSAERQPPSFDSAQNDPSGEARHPQTDVTPTVRSRFAVDLSPPPADADEQETPVVEEFRRLALEGVADELENPSHEEQSQRVQPQPVEEDAGNKNWDREQDRRDAQRVT